MQRSSQIAIAVLLVCALCAVRSQAQTLSLDLSQTDQTLLGFGAQIWAGDTDGHDVLSDLNARYARLQHGVNFFSFPTQPPADANTVAGDNFAAMKSHIASNFNGPGGNEPWHLPSIVSTNNWATANNVELILNEFQIAYSFLDSSSTQMLDTQVDDFATFWAAMLSYLDDQGVRPAYVELANEPDGTWNGRISPTSYNTLVKQTRALLDTHGFADVGILGPGLSTLGNTDWVNGLDADGVNSLAGWSTHTWDDDLGVDSRAQLFESAIDAKDPNKPVFITEFATDKFAFNGTTYGDPDQGGNAADQSEFAVQVVHNVISLVNYGAGSLLYWEGADQPWNTITWGLERLDGTKRPVYDALRTLTDILPNDSTVIEQTWSDNEISAAAFLKDDQLIVILANTTDQSETRTLDFSNASGVLQFREGEQFSNSTVSELSYAVASNSLEVALPQESTQALVFDILAPLPGDFNLSGGVDAADLLIWKSGYGTSSGAQQGDGNADDDGDVDGSDFLTWQQHREGVEPSLTATVPEPSSIAVAVVTLAVAALASRHRLSESSSLSRGGRRARDRSCVDTA